MTIALIAHTSQPGNGSTGPATTGGINTTGANLLIAAYSAVGYNATTISDSVGGNSNTWIALPDVSSYGNAEVRIFYCLNPTHVGAGHTFTESSTQTPVFAAAFSGVLALDTTTQVGGTSGSSAVTSLTLGTFTPAGANELLLSMFCPGAAAGLTSTPPTGFTLLDQQPGGGGVGQGGALAYQIQGSTSAVTPTWTASAAHQEAAAVVAFTAIVTAPVISGGGIASAIGSAIVSTVIAVAAAGGASPSGASVLASPTFIVSAGVASPAGSGALIPPLVASGAASPGGSSSLASVLQPAADVSTGGWTSSLGGSLSAAINELVPNDSNYITSPTGASSSIVQANGGVAAGQRAAVSYRAAYSTASQQVRVALLDGSGNQVALGEWHTPSTAYATITDYLTPKASASQIRFDAQPNAFQAAIGALSSGTWKLLTPTALTSGSGGIQPATVTASIAPGTVAGTGILTVTAASANSIGRDQYCTDAAVPNTRIKWQTSGTTGGVGTYLVDQSQTCAVTSITPIVPRTVANFDGGNGRFTSNAQVALMIGPGGGVGNFNSGYTTMTLDPVTGNVIMRQGGHVDGGSSEILMTNIYAAVPALWRNVVRPARLNSGAVPLPTWFVQSPASSSFVATTATASAAAGATTITLASVVSANSVTIIAGGGSYLWDAAGAMVPGTTVSGISGNVITLSTPLQAPLPAGTAVQFEQADDWPAQKGNIDGVLMPPSMHSYDKDAWLPGTDTFLLAGALGGGLNYQPDCGGGFAYSAGKPSASGMMGPYQAPGTGDYPLLAAWGFGLKGNTVSHSDGHVYVLNPSFGAHSLAVLRIDNPLTAPSITVVYATNSATAPNIFLSNTCIFPDPANGANFALFSDLVSQATGYFGIVSNFTSGSAVASNTAWTNAVPTFTGSPTVPHSFRWNPDFNVMACTDATDIWEFTVTWTGSAYQTGVWVKKTAGSTGDTPTIHADFTGGLNPRLDWDSATQSYIMMLGCEIRSYKR